jgi:hypothetical protein
MTANSAQSICRTTADPSSGSPIAARQCSLASATLPGRKKIAGLHARKHQCAQRMKVSGRHQEAFAEDHCARSGAAARGAAPHRPAIAPKDKLYQR